MNNSYNNLKVQNINEITPSKTFKVINIDIDPDDATKAKEKRQIGNNINNKEAIEQAIKKRLQTDRFAYDIYTANYGIDLNQYIGKTYDYIALDLQREIQRCLLEDDRITAVKNFKCFKVDIDAMYIEFDVYHIFGTSKLKTTLY